MITCHFCKATATDDGGWMLKLGRWYCPNCIHEWVEHYQ